MKKLMAILLLLALCLPFWTRSVSAAESTVTLFGQEFDSSAEFLDLSGIAIEDLTQLEAALSAFPNLKQVDMVDCGISNEEMDALNRRHPGIKFVWALYIRGIMLRTDATIFMPGKYGVRIYDSDCALLQYCHDLICIDLGHMPITDCSFLYGTPQVKYLILADTSLQDISPIGTLTKLEFLEIFNMGIVDYWPLTNCTSLKDLNISYTTFLDCTPLYQMTWLERLMMVGSGFNWDEQAQFRAELPFISIVFESRSATDKGWRYSPNYYAMRDLLGMHYMIL